MLTFIFAFLVAGTACYFSYIAGDGGHWGWAILAFFGGALAVLIPVNIFVRNRLTALFMGIQQQLMEAQNRIRTKANGLVQRGQATPRLAAQLEQEMTDNVRQVIPQLDGAKKYQLWNPLAKVQADLMKAQLLYQIKDFDGARPFLEKAMVLDPMILCMKMVLAWKKDAQETKELDKLFQKNISRFKYDRGTLCYATYSWILVKQNRLTEAVTLLDEAKKKTDDPVISQNWEALANNHTARFSNAGLGDQWYALGLEQPAPVKMAPQDRFGGRVRGGFRR